MRGLYACEAQVHLMCSKASIMPGHATVPERDLDPGFGDSRLADVPNRPVDPILADLLADQGHTTVLDRMPRVVKVLLAP